MGIRAGVHTVEVQLRGDDVGGIAVHFAARVMAAAACSRSAPDPATATPTMGPWT